ncbi:hypothetical protein ACLOJK_025599 [Asimina triloba]
MGVPHVVCPLVSACLWCWKLVPPIVALMPTSAKVMENFDVGLGLNLGLGNGGAVYDWLVANGAHHRVFSAACPCPCQPSFLVAVVLTSHSSRRGHCLIGTLAAIVHTPAAIGELLPSSTRRRLPLVLVADLLVDSRWCHLLAVLVRTPAAIFSPSSSPLVADLPCLASPDSSPLPSPC